ncbi:unnamed protein product [Rotaria socialis]|uniref:F-box domain-containing protein n=1 Tax=Rotaria socialis TaxID=392032 RepID=A0A817XYS8_9BILA|nr:unnamed protein product [Rotaria socialis]
MELESLPNEILLDLFEYFSIIQLLRDFNGLNFRLNQLLFVHASVYHLDFRSICRDDCKILCHQHLQAIIDRASSLRLSDDNDDNPQQINVLFSYSIILREFIHLRALSLCNLHSVETMNRIMIERRNLLCLTHLKLVQCDSIFERINSMHLFDSI